VASFADVFVEGNNVIENIKIVLTERDYELARRYLIKHNAQDLFGMLGL